jgi:hypothetical protein
MDQSELRNVQITGGTPCYLPTVIPTEAGRRFSLVRPRTSRPAQRRNLSSIPRASQARLALLQIAHLCELTGAQFAMLRKVVISAAASWLRGVYFVASADTDQFIAASAP